MMTPEEIAAEKAQKEAAKLAEKEAKAAEREAAKAAKAAEKEAEKAAKLAEKEAAKAAKLAEKEAKKEAAAQAKAEKAAAKEAKLAEREANRMPEQNGVRRPKPDTLCGKAWGIADQLSAQLGQPVPIANLLEATNAQGLNEGNVKAEYARWRKFHGVSGRVTLPKPEAPATTGADQEQRAAE